MTGTTVVFSRHIFWISIFRSLYLLSLSNSFTARFLSLGTLISISKHDFSVRSFGSIRIYWEVPQNGDVFMLNYIWWMVLIPVCSFHVNSIVIADAPVKVLAYTVMALYILRWSQHRATRNKWSIVSTWRLQNLHFGSEPFFKMLAW